MCCVYVLYMSQICVIMYMSLYIDHCYIDNDFKIKKSDTLQW